MNTRTVGGLLVLILLIGILIYTRLDQTDHSRMVARAVGMSTLVQVEGYEANRTYLDPLADLAHDSAIEKALEVARRRQAAGFDKDTYLAEFLEDIINQARNDGRQDLVKALTALRDQDPYRAQSP